MIKTKSPYYITIPYRPSGTTTYFSRIRIVIYIYKGKKDKSVVYDEKTYEILKKNPLGLIGDIDLDISNLINSSLSPKTDNFTNGVYDGDSAVWVDTKIYYESDEVSLPTGYYYGNENIVGDIFTYDVYSDPLETDLIGLLYFDYSSTPYMYLELYEYDVFDLAIKGYSYGNEGTNAQPPINGQLYFGEEIKVSRSSIVVLPFLTDEVEDTDIVVSAESIDDLEYIVLANQDSEAQVSYLVIDTSTYSDDEYIEVSLNGNLVTTLLLQDEFKHTPKDILFLNKEGQLTTVTFFKESKESLDITSEEFQGLRSERQFVEYLKNGRTSFTANTGWIDEENNEVIKQLILSDDVFEIVDGALVPLNLDTKSLDYKTRVVDKLINYEIKFKYSYNEINNR